MRAPCESLKERKREEKYQSFCSPPQGPNAHVLQCLVIFIIQSEDLRLEKFLKLNRDMGKKLCVLNQQFDGVRVGVKLKKSDLEVRAWNDSSLVCLRHLICGWPLGVLKRILSRT